MANGNGIATIKWIVVVSIPIILALSGWAFSLSIEVSELKTENDQMKLQLENLWDHVNIAQDKEVGYAQRIIALETRVEQLIE